MFLAHTHWLPQVLWIMPFYDPRRKSTVAKSVGKTNISVRVHHCPRALPPPESRRPLTGEQHCRQCPDANAALPCVQALPSCCTAQQKERGAPAAQQRIHRGYHTQHTPMHQRRITDAMLSPVWLLHAGGTVLATLFPRAPRVLAATNRCRGSRVTEASAPLCSRTRPTRPPTDRRSTISPTQLGSAAVGIITVRRIQTPWIVQLAPPPPRGIDFN